MIANLLKQKGLKLILASKSPRRKFLLQGLDVDFEIITQNTVENIPQSLKLEEIPVYLAKEKSKAIEIKDDWLVITADTVVILDNQIIGKPKDYDDAFRILRQLSGKMHKVITGVCLTTINKQTCFNSETKVWFKHLTDDEIDYYLKTYKPFDKAGAYGIQEWIGYIAVERIDGDFYNIVGLPVQKLYTELVKFLNSKF